MSICNKLEIDGDSKDEKMNKLIKKIRNLYIDLDAPLKIEDLNISKSEFESKMEELVLFTSEDVCNFSSPRPMTPDQCEKIFRYAYEGKDIDF